jgi:RNase P/RNase MRP subunit p29
MSYLILTAGILLLTGGFLLALRQRDRLLRWSTAEGAVVEQLPVRQTGETLRIRTAEGVRLVPKRLYRPVIEYKDAAGRKVRFKGSLFTRPMQYQVGRSVKVRYDPGNPTQAMVESKIEIWFYPGMLVGFGLFAIAMGLLGLLLI